MAWAYYNEIDLFAAEWLRKLISAGAVTDGEVDTRSILDVEPADLRGFTRHHFFAGIGVWDFALRLANWPEQRPVFTGSCPCQPFSAAGKGGGFADERHLWPAFFHLIRERRPATVLGEQVASADGLTWLDLVCSDLEGEGYAFGAADLCAAGVGAPHARQRLWFVAHSPDERLQRRAISNRKQPPQSGRLFLTGSSDYASFWSNSDWMPCRDGKARPVEPGTFPLAHGAPARVGRLRGYGNAINAEAAAAFIESVM